MRRVPRLAPGAARRLAAHRAWFLWRMRKLAAVSHVVHLLLLHIVFLLLLYVLFVPKLIIETRGPRVLLGAPTYTGVVAHSA